MALVPPSNLCVKRPQAQALSTALPATKSVLQARSRRGALPRFLRRPAEPDYGGQVRGRGVATPYIKRRIYNRLPSGDPKLLAGFYPKLQQSFFRLLLLVDLPVMFW